MVLEIEWPKTLFLPLAVNGTPSPVVASVPGTVEQCGRGYHAKVTIKSAKRVVLNDTSEMTEEDKKETALREQLQSFNTDLEDFYGLLGLNEFKFVASDDQVKQRWKLASMCCHPDKATPETRSKAELRYKAMQKAVETLLDKKLRKAYDSSLPFDDSLPEPKEGNGESFYNVYGSVFNANARFSINKKQPSLGDDDTPMKEVDKFYSFWLSFKSWREFSHPDEEKVNDGTWREERRRIERSNAKLRAAAKREETQRVRTLVEDAMKKDPRLVRQRNAEEEERAMKKKEKEDKIRAEQDEKERVVREAKEAEEKAKSDAAEAKIQKQMLKNVTKTTRKRFKKFGKIVITAEVFLVNRTKPLDLDDIEFVVKNSELEDLKALVQQFQKDVEAKTLELSYKMFCNQISKLNGEDLEAIAAKQAEADAAKAAGN